MKNFIEKVKANKLRSALIGLSVFLFGFIAVNIFNNINNSYATSLNDYTCSTSGYEIIQDSDGNYHCCPAGFIYKDFKYNGTTISSLCAKWVGGGICPSGTTGPGAVGTIFNGYCTTKALTPYKNAYKNACYYCASSNTYKWSGNTPSTSCPGGISWTKKSGVSQTNCERGNACYFCGNSQGGKYVWGLLGDNGSCTYQSSINKSSACVEKNIRTISATFNATNGGTLSGSATAQCTTTQSSPSSCKVTAPTATRSGYYLKGWSTSSSCSAYIGVDDNPSTEDTIYLNNYYQGNLYTCWGTTPPGPGDYTPENNVTEDPDETVVAYTRPIYTVTYDLNGGKFIDGTTSRISYIPADKAIGDPKTNPIKDGMKFKEWQLNGSKFDFSQKPTQNITLKAVYEELTEEDKLYYCESSSDVLEVSTKTCYNVMKPDNNKLYNYTLYTYKEGDSFCYAYNATNNTPGGVYFRNGVTATATGKKDEDYSSFGYPEKEAWVSKDTCLIATECTEDASIDRPACETRWDAIIYSTKSALLKEEKFDEDGTDVPIDDEPVVPDTPSDDGKDNTDKTDEEAEELPTGDALILIAWAVGIGALCYTVYYFRKKKEN